MTIEELNALEKRVRDGERVYTMIRWNDTFLKDLEKCPEDRNRSITINVDMLHNSEARLSLTSENLKIISEMVKTENEKLRKEFEEL